MALLAVMIVTGCANDRGRPAAPEPLKSIDMARLYGGRWYEIGRTPMWLTDGCVAGTTDYYRDAAGRLIERDACRTDTPQGEEKVIQGPVTLLTPDGTKISVRYRVWGILPLTWTYWMLDHGDDYDWFIMSDPSFETISLFTRSPRPPPALVELLKNRARELGYDPARLEFPPLFPPG
jgi:apolipoprotein D and lipocalin family protein